MLEELVAQVQDCASPADTQAELLRVLRSQEVALPTWFEDFQPERPPEKPVVVFTALEPDDVIALMCIRCRSCRPVAIFAADLTKGGTDEGGILVKKLLLAATGLGIAFLQDLYILDGSTNGIETTRIIRAAVAAEEARFCAGSSDWYIMAP